MQFADLLGRALDLLIVVVAFGGIIVVHELGHFLAAKWAGIRVLAFAIGFGPAICSFRKGLGWRRGSSADEAAEASKRGSAVSPTEYRLNWLPLGGYVQMLGQDDMNPAATSSERDSYQSAKPWKKLVVISAGVVLNVLLAGVLFVIVFMAGRKTDPAIVGRALAGTPAALAVARNAADLGPGLAEPGLQPGDRIVSIDGKAPSSFDDVRLWAAMSRGTRDLSIVVQRPNLAGTLEFGITPQRDAQTRLLSLGIEPAVSTTVRSVDAPERDVWNKALQAIGLGGLEEGSTLVSINGSAAPATGQQIAHAFGHSAGKPVELVFAPPGVASTPRTFVLEPRALLQESWTTLDDRRIVVEHLLGLQPVMMVGEALERGLSSGLRDGDVFARIGSVEYPSLSEGIREIRRHKGKDLALVLLRSDEGSNSTGVIERQRVELTVRVGRDGAVGFAPDDTATMSGLLARSLDEIIDAREQSSPPAGGSASIRAGSEVLSIDGLDVRSLAELRDALGERARSALDSGQTRLAVSLVLRLPLPPDATGARPTARTTLELDEGQLRAVSGLGWRADFNPAFLFEPMPFAIKASNPMGAIVMGVHETHRVMMSTYLTLARLVQGTVKVEHLKGPVGIAHVGTIVVDRGWVHFLFFLALISVNLAVINFLPMPIVDGGQFLIILAEMITGRPVPIGFQNVATTLGMVLIGTMFLIVTFNDIRNLF